MELPALSCKASQPLPHITGNQSCFQRRCDDQARCSSSRNCPASRPGCKQTTYYFFQIIFICKHNLTLYFCCRCFFTRGAGNRRCAPVFPPTLLSLPDMTMPGPGDKIPMPDHMMDTHHSMMAMPDDHSDMPGDGDMVMLVGWRNNAEE